MLTLVLSQHVVEWQTGSTQSFQRPQETQFCTKLDPLFSLSSTCQQKKSNIARKLPFLSLMLFFFCYTRYGRKVKLPSVSQNQWRKHFQVRSNKLQSTRNKALGFFLNSLLALNQFTCFMLHMCTLYGPLVFVPNIPSQWVLQSSSWWLQDWGGTVLATAVWPVEIKPKC